MSEAGFLGRSIGGRYRLEAQLGAGGMATVYLASDSRVERRVVVKIPHAELLQQPGFRDRFHREIQSLTDLQHRGVVPLYDCGQEPDGTPWCAVRYLPGGDLADRMERAGGWLSASEVAYWLPQVCETLDFIHAGGVLHRDVTPVNILFDERGNVFLSDFGVAAIVRAADETAVDLDPRLTAEGTFVGSATYAPPEAVYRSLSPAYDQYSLGCVVYHALCGYLPFPQVDPRALMAAKNSDAPTPIEEHGVPVPPEAAQAVMRTLEREPEARFASCRDFADAFVGDIPADVTQELVIRTPRVGRSPAIAGLGAALVAVVVALAAATWLWTRGEPEDGAEEESWLPDSLVGEGMPDGVVDGRFQAGSTREQIEDALEVCRRHQDACPSSLYDDEELREVEVAPVELDRTEVTNRAFASFVTETDHLTTAEDYGTSRDGPFEERGLSWRQPLGPRSSHEDLPDHPVVHVSAGDAEAYCRFHGKRLPTEDEWELAARGRDGSVYPWGDRFEDDQLSWGGNGARLRSVGSFPAGPFGHRDLAGNVWEWTATNRGRHRVLKGGSYRETNPADLRGAVRLVAHPDDRSGDIGFRCAQDAPQ